MQTLPSLSLIMTALLPAPSDFSDQNITWNNRSQSKSFTPEISRVFYYRKMKHNEDAVAVIHHTNTFIWKVDV